MPTSRARLQRSRMLRMYGITKRVARNYTWEKYGAMPFNRHR